MTCLLCPEYATNAEYCNYAEMLLFNFVEDFATLYGPNQIVYNVHSAMHLAQDRRNYGPLDKISSFPFENKLGQIKKMVRRPQNPIAQIIRRCLEKERLLENTIVTCFKAGSVHSREHFAGPIPSKLDHIVVRQYKHYKSGSIFISSAAGNNCFKIRGKMGLVRNVLCTSSNDTLIVYSEFVKLDTFYSFPCDSTRFNVYFANYVSEELQCVYVSEVERKFVIMPFKDGLLLYLSCIRIKYFAAVLSSGRLIVYCLLLYHGC